jgi:prefoldin subunit 5
MDQIKAKVEELQTKKSQILDELNAIKNKESELTLEYAKLDGAIRELSNLVPHEDGNPIPHDN